MKNSLDIKRNIILICLIVLSIYQTRELWFKEYLNRNFFYIYSSKDIVNKNYNNDFLTPYRIIGNLGDNKFYIFYDNLKENELKKIIDHVIKLTLENGKYIDTYDDIDWNYILNKRSFIYEYKFSVKSSIFKEVFKEKRNLITSKVEKFENIIIAPDPNLSNTLNLFFIDKENNKYYEYKLVKSGINDMISMQLRNIHKNLKENEIYYMSSKLMGIEFSDNIFLSRWQGDFYNYKEVKRSIDPYFNKSLYCNIGDGIKLFFDNPSVVWQDNKNDTYIYSDENIVVKYFSNNVLEYLNYKNISKKRKTRLLTDYASAITFIEHDNFVKNNYFLSNYEEKDDIRTFYFDYTINGFPIKLMYDKEHIKTNSLSHFIEVTVENGTVVKYKKFTYVYDIVNTNNSLFINNIMRIIDNLKDKEILDISLEYIELNKYDDNIKLDWIVNFRLKNN